VPDIVGTSGNDTLPGTGDADNITALAGNDTVNAGDGNDTINGGTGNDTLNGEGGDDTFIEDEITSALDVFNGGDGFDTLELRVIPIPLVLSVGLFSPHTLSAPTSLVSVERLLFASQVGHTVQATLLYSAFASTGLTQIVGGVGRDTLTITLGTAATAATYNMLNLPITGFEPVSLNAWDHAGDSVAFSASAVGIGVNVTLNAHVAASYMQVLIGGRGNDIINGSGNADTIISSSGNDQINAGGGNDAISLANGSVPTGPGTWGPPTTNTGAGSIWDGGAGSDVISIGGTVDLQATLLNIEGVYFQPAFYPPLANTTRQDPAVLILDSAHIAMLPTNAFFTGTGTVRFNIDDGLSFSIPTGYVMTAGSDVSFAIDAGNGDGLTFTGGSGDDEIVLGYGSQIAYGGDGNDTLNNGVSFFPGDGLISMFGGNGDDILILDNPVEDNLFLDGGAGDDLLQLHSYSTTSPGNAPILHALTGTDGSGITGIEAVQFVSVVGQPMTLIANIDAGFGTIIGGAGFDRMIFNVNSAGTYAMPDFALVNWNSQAGDFVGLGPTSDATFAVTLNGRNDISQYLFGALAADTLNGGNMSDFLFGAGGANIVNGNGGDDVMFLDAGANGSSFDGGAGNDALIVNSTTTSLASLASIESVQVAGGSGLTLTGSQFATGLASNTTVGGTGSITVNMTAGINFLSQNFVFSGSGVTVTVNGSSGIDIIKCGTGVQIINSGDGVDQIRGGTSADTINAGAGNDKIIGFTGADIITGGTGNDQFRYLLASDSGLGAGADRITDYAIGQDRLNFSAIDTNAGLAGIQGFAFVANGAFSGGGTASIRYINSGADLLVQADVNGDGIADMEIILQGLNGGTLTAADFIL
jgi:Ca2+-binding RTX toxin-like protein